MKQRIVVAALISVVGLTGSLVDPNDTTVTNQQITGTLSIMGTIFDARGNPLSGVTVRLAGSRQASAMTGANGTYAFTMLGAGSYSVQPTLSGCTFAPSVVNLNGL